MLLDSESHAFSTTLADYLTYNIYQGVTNTGTIVSGGGPSGDPYLVLGHDSAFVRVITAASQTIFFGCRIALAGDPAGISISILDQSAASQIVFRITSAGGLVVTCGGTTLATLTSGTFPVSGWFYFEAGLTLGASGTGSVTVRINGASTVLALTGVTTQATTSPTIGGIEWSTPSNGIIVTMTHYYLCDGSGPAPWNYFLGNVRVQPKNPSAVVAGSTFGLVGGSTKVAAMSSSPPTQSHFVTGSSTSASDLYTFPPSTLADIFGVRAVAAGWKTDAGMRGFGAQIVSVGVETPPYFALVLGSAFQASEVDGFGGSSPSDASTLDGITGGITLTVGTATYTAASISFAGVLDFSQAALWITAALNAGKSVGAPAVSVTYQSAMMFPGLAMFVVWLGVPYGSTAAATISGTLLTALGVTGPVLEMPGLPATNMQQTYGGGVGMGLTATTAVVLAQTDPSTGNPWTLAAVNALQAGFYVQV